MMYQDPINEQHEHKNKWDPNWLGPYQTITKVNKHTFKLSTMEGDEFLIPKNG